MIKVINNLWSIIKMVTVLLIMVIVIKFVGMSELLQASAICLGLYVAVKAVDLGIIYVKSKIKPDEDIYFDEENFDDEEEINPEIVYVENLINEIKSKARKTAKDKNTLDLLNIKLKQLKNV